MKVFVDAFLKHNLGDDLFIYILSNRYPKHKFYLVSDIKYTSYSNMKIYGGKYIKLLDLIFKVIFKRKKNLITFLSQKFKYNICIGGSMFMENHELDNPSLFYRKMYEKNKCKNRYIMGVNFGPYKTIEYYDEYKKYFSNCVDVCFRDNASFTLFKDLNNVRKAPDIVFSLDTSNIKVSNKKRVIVSVIYLQGDTELNKKFEIYKTKIKEMIIYFYNQGYEIVLMSFCDEANDNETVNSIMNDLSDLELNSYSYNGNITEALNIIAESEIIVASRYHASILGILFEKTIIPIAYSAKTINALKDIYYKGEIIDFNCIEKLNIKDFINNNLNYKYNGKNLNFESQKHFLMLDKLFKKGEE